MVLGKPETSAPSTTSQGLVNVPDLTRVWNGFRLIAGSFTLLAGAFLGVLWGWRGGYLTAALALAVIIDASDRRRRPRRSPIPAMALDVTLIGVAMVVVQLEPAGIGAPFIYMMVVPALLLPWRQAWGIMGYTVVWVAVALSDWSLLPLAADASPEVITAVAYLIFATHTVALVVVVSSALDRSHRARDQFLASVSHEIRTPLTSILGWSRMLREGSVTLDASEQAEAIQMIESEAEEVTGIIEDLLAAAQLDIGVLAVQEQSVDLDTEARAVVASMDLDENRRIEIRGSAHPVLGDPLRVRQIARNLISNAMRYGGPETWISLSSEASTCMLTVSDNGSGIPQNLQRSIFEPYVRASGARSAIQAIGLGLTVSRNLANLMGGDLQYSRSSGATDFTLTLPIASSQEPAAVNVQVNEVSSASR